MQNQLININQNMTMSSLEIVKVINAIRKSDGDNTELQHKHVLDKIKLILPNSAEFLAQYKDSTGRALPCYNLPKRESILLTMSYSYKVQAAVYDAWEKLENQQSLTVFGHDTSTHRGALLALVASLDKIEADKPKVAYFNALVDRNLLVNIRDSAKEIGIKQNEFVKWLLDNKYVYRDAREQLKPYAQYTPDLFELKEYVNPHNGQSGNQLLTTPRGRETFNLLINGAKQ